LLAGFAVRWTAGISGAEVTMSFINQAAFNHHRSEQIAISADRRPSKAITDPQGRVQIYIQTGGILNPSRYELHPGAIVFRSVRHVAAGTLKASWRPALTSGVSSHAQSSIRRQTTSQSVP
jgi:hypothetical protein